MTSLQLAMDTASVLSNREALQTLTSNILIRLFIDLSTVFILVRYIYYPIYKHRELFFMYFIFNVVIFLISFLLNKVDLSMGAAFGLFAVFSMLRYKTEEISIKDMTYLFLVIATGLVSAVTRVTDSSDTMNYVFLIGINGIVLVITFLLESSIFMKKESVKTILYEKIELIREGREEELLADIKSRTGFNVHRYSIQNIDFLKDATQIKIYFYE